MARWWRRSRGPDPLGTGVWRRADDRFRRAVDRYHQVLERVEGLDGSVWPPVSPADTSVGPQRLAATGDQLARLAERVDAVCVAAQALAPSGGEEIPPGPGGVLLDVHRAIARASTLVAQSAESVTMVLVTLRAERPDEALAATSAAARAAEQAGIHIARAESLLPDALTPGGV